MPLQSCRECNASVSTEAQMCPQCGCPNPTIPAAKDNGQSLVPTKVHEARNSGTNVLSAVSQDFPDKASFRRRVVLRGMLYVFVVYVAVFLIDLATEKSPVKAWFAASSVLAGLSVPLMFFRTRRGSGRIWLRILKGIGFCLLSIGLVNLLAWPFSFIARVWFTEKSAVDDASYACSGLLVGVVLMLYLLLTVKQRQTRSSR